MCGPGGVADGSSGGVADDRTTPKPGPEECGCVHDVAEVVETDLVARQALKPGLTLLVRGDDGVNAALGIMGDDGLDGRVERLPCQG